MVYGQMNEPPGNRLRVASTGLTIAESFRDEGRDVLFFVDNIYRYTLAGTEVSALLGRMPSRWVPAYFGRRNGQTSGTNYIDKNRFHYFYSSSLRTC